jgi:GTP-binding protein
MTEAPAFLETDFSEAQLEQGRLLFAQSCDFLLGVAKLEQLPESALPEIAFCGRSNVGKSTLVNALTGRSTLAKTSNTPGRTQQINMFDLGGRLMLADLPGHGYAKAPLNMVKQWHHLINSYLRGRPELRRVCFLIDSRHGIKEVDRDVMKMLDKAAVVYQVVLTKADKISKTALDKCLDNTRTDLAKNVAAHPEVVVTSSQKGTGIATLRAHLAALALPR